MFIRYDKISPRYLTGLSAEMSLNDDGTFELFSRFMRLLMSVVKEVNFPVYDLRIFHGSQPVMPDTKYVKWAAVETNKLPEVPDKMQNLILIEGEYAVFLHKGTAANAGVTFHYIFNKWLPEAAVKIDNRPHFDILLPGYKPNDPMAEHEIWIPIIRKT